MRLSFRDIRTFLRDISGGLLALSMCVALWACGDERGPEPATDGAESEDAIWLKLRLWMAVSPETRAEGDSNGDPLGGEEGDGRESALDRENRIRDINLFFYNRVGGFGLNAQNPGNIAVKKHVYDSTTDEDGFLRDDFGGDKTLTARFLDRLIKVEEYTPDENDWVIVIANYGEKMSGVSTLADLRDLVFESTWTSTRAGSADAKDASFFTMATARFDNKFNSTPDGKVMTDKRDGSKSSPFYVQTTLERTAARIDLWYEQSNMTEGKDELVYTISDGDATIARVRLKNAAVVNGMQKGSYAFKHVTEGFDTGKILVCSDETPGQGKPTNYVIEPTTLAKNSSAGAQPADLYGNTSADYIRKNADNAFSAANSMASILNGGESDNYSESGLPYNRYTILGYVNENTETGTGLTSDYNTGLVFKAVYQPTTVYSAYDSGSDSLTEDAGYTTGGDFWQYSPTFTATGEKDNLYFSNAEAAEAYHKAHPEKNGKVTEYAGGVCYYNLWLRHANITDDPHKPFEMEYAIVRNNIYRVGVSFSGPGTPTPEVREPDNIISRIFVRKWNFRLMNVVEI